jgi:hypothetical protein
MRIVLVLALWQTSLRTTLAICEKQMRIRNRRLRSSKTSRSNEQDAGCAGTGTARILQARYFHCTLILWHNTHISEEQDLQI